MRKLKIAVWIFMLYIIRTVFCGAININGAMPDLLLAFVIVFSCGESDLKIMIVTLCGILIGSETGRIFQTALFAAAAAAVSAWTFSKKAKVIPSVIKVTLLAFVFSGLLAAADYILEFKTLDLNAIILSALPYAVYTAAAACVMYPAVKRTLFRAEDKKRLIV